MSLYSRTVIPTAVLDELERGREMGVELPSIRALAWIQVVCPEKRGVRNAELGRGEQEVLALGMQIPGALLILDDGLARVHARKLRLPFTGTLGILLRAKVDGHVSSLKPLIQRLCDRGFHLSAQTRAAVLKLAGE
jgi:predicted nucleic acid-binding protein